MGKPSGHADRDGLNAGCLRAAPRPRWRATDGPTRLNPFANLFRYDLRRGHGVVDALCGDPLAIVAGLGLLAGAALVGAWAVATR